MSLSLAASLVAMLFGCEVESIPLDPSTAYLSFCNEASAILAQKIDECFGSGGFIVGKGVGPDCSGSILKRFETGRLLFDGTLAAQCLVEMRSESCLDLLLAPPLPCSAAYTGTLAEGARCEAEDCAAGLRCQLVNGCQGICGPRPPLHSPCSLEGGATCPPGSVCVTDQRAGPTCFPDLGAACTGSIGCAPTANCASSGICMGRQPGETCEEDAWCHPLTLCEDGRCQSLPHIGESCTRDGICPPSIARCVGGRCQLRHAVGEECRGPDDCVTGLECLVNPATSAATCAIPTCAGM